MPALRPLRVTVAIPPAFDAWARDWLREQGEPWDDQSVRDLFRQAIAEFFDPETPPFGDDPPCCDPGGGIRSPD